MTTIIMGKMEMELPDMYIMNRFIGTCRHQCDTGGSIYHLFERSKSEVPTSLNPQVGVRLSWSISVHQCAPCWTEARGWRQLYVLIRPVKNQDEHVFYSPWLEGNTISFKIYWQTSMRNQAAIVAWESSPLCYRPVSPLLTSSGTLYIG